MERKEEMEQLVKAGFLREKKNKKAKKTSDIKLKGKEVSMNELHNLLSAKKIVFQGYGYAIICKNKSK